MVAVRAALAINTAPFKKLLLSACGFSFENEREAALVSGLRRRIASTRAATPEGYLALLTGDPEELRRLVELLTVNETYFFREPDYLQLITERFVPEILASRPSGPVKILSAGCSTGEEPYSLAMLLRDIHGPACGQRISITGVDIDGNVIAGARRGVYGKGSFRGMDPKTQQRHFEPFCEGGWRLTQEVRSQVRFETVNLLGAAYPAVMLGVDIILYRNVSIYFPAQVQQEVFSRLADCLNDGGYLLVGAAETLHHDIGVLTLMEQDALYVYRKIPGVHAEDRRRIRRDPALSGMDRAGKPGRAGQGPAPATRVGLARPVKPAPPAPGVQAAATSSRAEKDVHALFDDALERARAGKHEAALKLLNTALARDGGFVKAYTLKGSILLSDHRLEEARAACERALAIDPLCLEAKLMSGMVTFQQENCEEALKRFREAIYLDASCWLAHFYLAEIMYLLGEKKRAKGAYEAVSNILEGGSLGDQGMKFFPLAVNAQQYMAICRHKLSLLKPIG